MGLSRMHSGTPTTLPLGKRLESGLPLRGRWLRRFGMLALTVLLLLPLVFTIQMGAGSFIQEAHRSRSFPVDFPRQGLDQTVYPGRGRSLYLRLGEWAYVVEYSFTGRFNSVPFCPIDLVAVPTTVSHAPFVSLEFRGFR